MVPLCMKCCREGHMASACKYKDWTKRSRLTTIEDTSAAQTDQLCTRCDSLDVIKLLTEPPPWTSQADLTKAFDEGHERILSLGTIGELELQADCPFCQVLVATCPQPVASEQELILVPDWTINRVAGELGAIRMDTPEKQAYSTCLLPTLKPTGVALPSGLWAHRGDAICLVEADEPSGKTLGGKRVKSEGLAVDTIQCWVKACSERHDRACLPVSTDDLHAIRLIDVRTRTVVSYPGHKCEYIALSYVWGDATQQVYKLGDVVKPLPNTLEDAITLTGQLGKQYLWIDSVCID